MGELHISSLENQPENPFSAVLSGYGRYENGQLLSVYSPTKPMREFHAEAHESFRKFVLSEEFACIAGQAAVKTDQYAFCAYPDMTSSAVAEGVCHDLQRYKGEFGLHDIPNMRGMRFVSFIAAFKEPSLASQLEGAEALCQLLVHMHQADLQHFDWDPNVSHDVNSTKFSYSNGGDAFFIPMMYPYSGSPARRSEMTFVVFNAHLIFEKLRGLGSFDKLRDIIRGRQAWIHPALADHGTGLEWQQYALVDPDETTQQKAAEIQKKVMGTCPFRPR